MGGGGGVWQLILLIGCYRTWHGGGGGDVWQLIVPIGCYWAWYGGGGGCLAANSTDRMLPGVAWGGV